MNDISPSGRIECPRHAPPQEPQCRIHCRRLRVRGAVACGPKKQPKPPEPPKEEVVVDAGPPVEEAGPPVQKSLYERLGGKDGIKAVVDTFVKNVSVDKRVNKLFAKTTGARLEHFKQMLQDQLCEATGGPDCKYTGKDMKAAHKGMKITEAQFNAVVEDLKMALEEKGVGEGERSDLFALLAPMKDDIVEVKDKKRSSFVKSGVADILQAHVAEYTERIEPARDPLLAKMEARAAKNRNPISDPEVASLLDILVRAQKPARIVEVGTNIGYGAIVLSRAGGDRAHVDTVEKNPEHVGVAREYVKEAGLAARITVHEDDAIAFLEKRTESGRFRVHRLREGRLRALPRAALAAHAGGRDGRGRQRPVARPRRRERRRRAGERARPRGGAPQVQRARHDPCVAEGHDPPARRRRRAGDQAALTDPPHERKGGCGGGRGRGRHRHLRRSARTRERDERDGRRARHFFFRPCFRSRCAASASSRASKNDSNSLAQLTTSRSGRGCSW